MVRPAVRQRGDRWAATHLEVRRFLARDSKSATPSCGAQRSRYSQSSASPSTRSTPRTSPRCRSARARHLFMRPLITLADEDVGKRVRDGVDLGRSGVGHDVDVLRRPRNPVKRARERAAHNASDLEVVQDARDPGNDGERFREHQYPIVRGSQPNARTIRSGSSQRDATRSDCSRASAFGWGRRTSSRASSCTARVNAPTRSSFWEDDIRR